MSNVRQHLSSVSLQGSRTTVKFHILKTQMLTVYGLYFLPLWLINYGRPAVLSKIQKSFISPTIMVCRYFDFPPQNLKYSFMLEFSTKRRSPHFGWKLYWSHQRSTTQPAEVLYKHIWFKACALTFHPLKNTSTHLAVRPFAAASDWQINQLSNKLKLNSTNVFFMKDAIS